MFPANRLLKRAVYPIEEGPDGPNIINTEGALESEQTAFKTALHTQVPSLLDIG